MIPPRFAVIDISYENTDTGVIIKATTDVPCHLWLRRTSTKPRIHLDPVLKRGLATHAEPRFCFVVPEDDEQDEPGDTPEHTFPQPDWPVCVTRYHYFWGTITGNDSPSESAIFEFHRTKPPTTATFYPDPDPELTSVDGIAYVTKANQTWDQIHGHVGTGAVATLITIFASIVPETSPNLWRQLVRAIILFDTSTILPTDNILSGRVNIWNDTRRKTVGSSPTYAIFSSNPGSNTTLVRSDYPKFGTTPLSNILTYDDLIPVGKKTFILNAAGLNAITKGGITKLAIREATYDAANIAPPWTSSGFIEARFWSSEHPSGDKPELQITYEP